MYQSYLAKDYSEVNKLFEQIMKAGEMDDFMNFDAFGFGACDLTNSDIFKLREDELHDFPECYKDSSNSDISFKNETENLIDDYFTQFLTYDNIENIDECPCPDIFRFVSPRTFQPVDIPDVLFQTIKEESDTFLPSIKKEPDSFEQCIKEEQDSFMQCINVEPDSYVQCIKEEPMLDQDDDIDWLVPGNRHLALKKKLTYLDIDHCYSAPPPKPDENEDTFNSPPFSPCSTSSSEVDVETIPSKILQPQIMPKLMTYNSPIQVSSSFANVSCKPQRRGRKPNKLRGNPNKRNKVSKTKTLKNSQVHLNPKTLKEAIKKQNYITKAGRVCKVNNSVETTPSSSSPSSLQSSRCNSDSEDGVDKRASHNMAERNRRQQLCNLFQFLRRKTPKTRRNTKASKVLILNSAKECVDELRKVDETRQKLINDLEYKLSYLRSLQGNKASSR